MKNRERVFGHKWYCGTFPSVLFGCFVFVSSIGSVHANSCYDTYSTDIHNNWFRVLDTGIEQGINAADESITEALDDAHQDIMGSLRTLVRQKAVTGSLVSDMVRSSNQQLAASIATIHANMRIKQARFDFSGEFGQGYRPCHVFATRQAISNRETDVAAARRDRVGSEVMAGPGKYADKIRSRRELIQANQQFCTEDHVASGLCEQVGEHPGASINAATLFEVSQEGDALHQAKVTFVNNLVGLPDAPIPENSGSSPAAQAYALAKARKDALISPAIASLKEIQLDHTGIEGGETGDDRPLSSYFRDEVKRYAGNSEEYEAWSKVMAAQNERGAMVEFLKIKALSLAIMEKQYRQYERMEAQLAALVAMQMNESGQAGEADHAANKAREQDVQRQVQ